MENNYLSNVSGKDLNDLSFIDMDDGTLRPFDTMLSRRLGDRKYIKGKECLKSGRVAEGIEAMLSAVNEYDAREQSEFGADAETLYRKALAEHALMQHKRVPRQTVLMSVSAALVAYKELVDYRKKPENNAVAYARIAELYELVGSRKKARDAFHDALGWAQLVHPDFKISDIISSEHTPLNHEGNN